MKLISTVLRILLGLFFILSGVLKLYPVEPFELSFISLGVAAWNTAPIIARLMIGIEFLLGFLLIINFRIKRFTLHAAFVLMILFTSYLLYEIFLEGNAGSCGCFGIYFQLTPLQSLLKNGGLISIIILLWFMLNDVHYRFLNGIAAIGIVLSLAMPFILNPVDFMARKNMQPEIVNFQLSREKILEENTFGKPSVDLFTGKHIISFMTLTCPHCRQAAEKIHVINKRHPEISFFIFLNGKDEMLESFFSSTHSESIPNIKMNAAPFASLTGGSWPAIWWVDNGVVVKKSVYYTLNEDEIVEWINQP